MGVEDRDWYRERQKRVMEQHYYNPREFRSTGGLGPAGVDRLWWFWPKWRYIKNTAEALIAPVLGALVVLAGPCIVGWLLFRTDPRIAAWQFAQLLVGLREGRWLVFAEANLAVVGVTITLLKPGMRSITWGGGLLAASLWIALPVLAVLYGVLLPLFFLHGFNMATITSAPTLLVQRIAATNHPVELLLIVTIYGVWGLALWVDRVFSTVKVSRKRR